MDPSTETGQTAAPVAPRHSEDSHSSAAAAAAAQEAAGDRWIRLARTQVAADRASSSIKGHSNMGPSSSPNLIGAPSLSHLPSTLLFATTPTLKACQSALK